LDRLQFLLAGALALAASVSCALAQEQTNSVAVSGGDETKAARPEENVHPLARPEFDEGMVSADTPLARMLLLLKPSLSQEAALDALVEEQQNPESPEFHQWLTPEEYGARFGADAVDLARVAAWLTAQGFAIDEIFAGRRIVEFSGSAAQVSDAFHTEIHRYQVKGVMHIANSQEPEIPAALAGAVRGVVSLHDFRRKAELHERSTAGLEPAYSAGSTHYLFPADFATIYDLVPLYGDGIDGARTGIAIAGRSNIELSDVATFRATAGLPANAPAVVVDGADPGLVAGDQDESTLDVEWSGAVAPEASVNLVVARSTATTDGVDLAATYIVNHAAAQVVSVSYGSCEQEMGATEIAFYNDLWEQAASEGISVLVASGDAGAAGCAAGADVAGTEQAVNGLCSPPYATCVGGTEFDEGSNVSEYWSAANSADYESAFGYIPEVVWNESAANGGTGMWASGGGASAVYEQPAWQADLSGTAGADGMRAVPDVALAAANHDGSLAIVNGEPFIVSGTSVATPDFAGIMALVIEKQGSAAQGNVNPTFYGLAAGEHNPFHATQSGNNDVPGVGGFAASGGIFNLATGLGSVDGAELVNNWSTGPKAVQMAPRPASCTRFSLLPGGCKLPLRAPTPIRRAGLDH
jgi:pseudomonalisin